MESSRHAWYGNFIICERNWTAFYRPFGTMCSKSDDPIQGAANFVKLFEFWQAFPGMRTIILEKLTKGLGGWLTQLKSTRNEKSGLWEAGKKDVKMFLRKKVAPQVAKMKHNVVVSMDRGFYFKPDEIEEELKEGGAKNIEDVWIFPPNAGKLCDPLES